MMNRRRLLLILGLLFASGISESGRLKAESENASLPPSAFRLPPSMEYAVRIRYQVRAARNERLAQFFALTNQHEATPVGTPPGFLDRIGFIKDQGPEDEPENPSYVRMSGTITSANAHKLLRDLHIKSILLVPRDHDLGADPDRRIKVQLRLVGGLPLERQRAIFDQTRDRLYEIGFREAVAYDHRTFPQPALPDEPAPRPLPYSRVVGTIPLAELDTLLKDLRYQPAGWLAPLQPERELPRPLRDMSPILVTEVIPEPEGVPPLKEPSAPPDVPKGQEHIQKLTADLRDRLAKEAEEARPLRVEVILVRTPVPGDPGWRQELAAAAPGLAFEGIVGPVVSVLLPPGQISRLAALPIVSTVRLPRSGLPQARPDVPAQGGNQAALRATLLDRLHLLRRRGQGVRVAVIGADFRGSDVLKEKKLLPRQAELLDLTAERQTDLQPDPYPDDGQVFGRGTQLAQAVALAAPEADLVLIRVDPGAMHQVLTVARAINAETHPSAALRLRLEEVDGEKQVLGQRREELLFERKVVLNNFSQDPGFVKRREEYFKKQTEFNQEERLHYQRAERYLRLAQAVRELTRVQVVVSPLVWNEGFPADGSAALTRYFEERPFRSTVWLQAAGDTRDQVWAGVFRDEDINGVMEFAAPDRPLLKERWSHELNFLAWHPFAQKLTPEIPAGANLRVTLQWREPHDPEFFTPESDPYREPLAHIRLMVLRQRDPTGEKLAIDDMEVVDMSHGLPQRLENRPNFATFEHTVSFTVDRPGRYAVRVLGFLPAGTRPPGEPALAAQQRFGEIRPRIFVDVLDPPSRAAGRAVMLDYPTAQGALGVPSVSRGVVTVGAVDPAGQVQPYGVRGEVLNMELVRKPDVLAPDTLAVAVDPANTVQGTDMAAAFAAGLTAAVQGAGTPPHFLFKLPHLKPGELLRVPRSCPP